MSDSRLPGSGNNLNQHWLEYVARLEQRQLSEISLFVIHCTELPDLETARKYAERIQYQKSRTGNSGHFYIDRDGSVCQYVPLNRSAHHVSGYNQQSIGIELVNNGRYPNWHHSDSQDMTEAYPSAQIDALIGLINDMKKVLQNINTIAGHQDLDTREIPAEDNPRISISRKLDPGPMFPWVDVLERTALTRIS